MNLNRRELVKVKVLVSTYIENMPEIEECEECTGKRGSEAIDSMTRSLIDSEGLAGIMSGGFSVVRVTEVEEAADF